MSKLQLAEYIWLDGAEPTQGTRSKAKVVTVGMNPKIEDFPEWSFDGSSTNQADGNDSDCLLKPVSFVKDPIRGEGNFLVMCEVLNPDGTPHLTNGRAKLRKILDSGASKYEPWVGFEQEYTLFHHRNPLGWPDDGFPGPQGPYYCGVGAKCVYGREIVEEHLEKALEAGLMIYGINAEVMPGQWEFQTGYRGVDGESPDALTICDHTWMSRWLLERVSEPYGVSVSYDNKPIKGDWNGAGMHTNFSTNAMRDKKSGREAIDKAIALLEKKHADHIPLYGARLAERLTGLHETCDINTFASGVADRGSSIRVPQPVHLKGYGYLEDRRPGANADPYMVAARLCATIAEVDDSLLKEEVKLALSKAA